ncbi:DUF4402 domain-containing protein [Flavobacterium sp. K5-23]|uniref:DUF4402 domain-containing protein n=1 Tax=Flavobacterium sp. K5-23 TaxID=2746225 RepID=UPI00200C71F5|nr:DUF4402 domain-containing protein [Flavobacterium sp. K5-23]UQD57334.1 DUF4402 domain-containing protein [Flavobacterium sp. K5-23]
MKKNLLLLFVVFVFTTLASNVSAQTIATVTGTTAGAKLIRPMGLSRTSALHFGTINILTPGSGTVILNPSDATRTFTGVLQQSLVNPPATNAAFNVTGTKDTFYLVSLPSEIFVTDGTTTMTIDNITASFATAGAIAFRGILNGSGQDSFKVGGTLNVTALDAGGVYAGIFNVSVDYN